MVVDMLQYVLWESWRHCVAAVCRFIDDKQDTWQRGFVLYTSVAWYIYGDEVLWGGPCLGCIVVRCLDDRLYLSDIRVLIL